MNLFYNREKNTWFSKESFCWGKNEVLLPSSRLSRYDDIGFSLQQKKNKLGPLIGILTETSKKNHLFAGNTSKFKRIAQAAMLRNGLAFVFTPEGIQTESIKGFLFLTDENKWIAATFPFPDIVYNRVPSRNFEQTTKFQRTLIFLQTNSIPYFNRSFFSKSDVYETLSSSPFLQKYLPHTTVFNDIEDAKEMLNIHKRIFLKPDLGYKGNGLTMIEYRRDDSYIVQTVSSPPVKKSMIELDHFLRSYMATQKWIIQEAIHLKTINQSVFDLRILVHENNSKWTISGIGGRLAKKGGIATHIPNGGTLLNVKNLSPPLNMTLLESIVAECGRQLQKKFFHIGEFSIDLGISKEGQYYIFECNSKPMVFDEPFIRKKGLTMLCRSLFEKAGFNFDGIN